MEIKARRDSVSEWLKALRAQFPDWAIIYDPWRHRWYALRGLYGFVHAASAIDLVARLESESNVYNARQGKSGSSDRKGNDGW